MMSATSTRLVARAILLGGALYAGCGGSSSSGPDGTSTPKYAFGSHPLAYAPGTIRPSGTQAELDETVKGLYQRWKTNYLVQGCGGYYVCTNEVVGACKNDGALLLAHTDAGVGIDGMPVDMHMTVSEGHGYGMLLAVLMAGVDPDARATFDGLAVVRKSLPSPYSPDLMSWHVDAGCTPPIASDNDAATDGDLDSAFAFLLAEQQWSSPHYGRQGRDTIDAVLNHEMNPRTHLPLLGDWANLADDQHQYFSTRLSDHMTDHFRTFAKVTKDDFWSGAITAVYGLMTKLQTMFAPNTGLVPDFVKDTDTHPTPVGVAEAVTLLGEDLTTDYDYNACRVPWRLGTDYVVNGDPAAKTVLTNLNNFIKAKTNGDASMIMDGYTLAGQPHTGAGPNGCFTGSFGVAAMIDSSDQAWLDAVWKNLKDGPDDDYYGDTIRLITMIVMSGNWWTP